jgi:hypothetical protein
MLPSLRCINLRNPNRWNIFRIRFLSRCCSEGLMSSLHGSICLDWPFGTLFCWHYWRLSVDLQLINVQFGHSKRVAESIFLRANWSEWAHRLVVGRNTFHRRHTTFYRAGALFQFQVGCKSWRLWLWSKHTFLLNIEIIIL